MQPMWIASETAGFTRSGKRVPRWRLAVYARMGRKVQCSTVFANRLALGVLCRGKRVPRWRLAV